jgi:SAM-dependent methyltransferase
VSVTGDGLRIIGDEQNDNGRTHRARYEWAAKVLPAGVLVLDYGCGTGYGSALLRDVGHSVVALDNDPTVADFARERWGVHVVKRIPMEPVGAVVAFEVLEHLQARPVDTFRMLARLADGVAIASVPYRERRNANQHHSWFRLDETDFAAVQGAVVVYQQADGSIGPERSGAQNMIVTVGIL